MEEICLETKKSTGIFFRWWSRIWYKRKLTGKKYSLYGRQKWPDVPANKIHGRDQRKGNNPFGKSVFYLLLSCIVLSSARVWTFILRTSLVNELMNVVRWCFLVSSLWSTIKLGHGSKRKFTRARNNNLRTCKKFVWLLCKFTQGDKLWFWRYHLLVYFSKKS